MCKILHGSLSLACINHKKNKTMAVNRRKKVIDYGDFYSLFRIKEQI